MGISCGGTLVKIVLGIFNFIGLAIGSFVIYLGVRIFQFNNGEHLENIIKENLNGGALIVVLFGSAIALIALIGFVGACCENSTLLNVYGFIVLALLVLQCVGIYFGYRYQDKYFEKFSQGVRDAIKDTFNKNEAEADRKLAYALQNIQLNMKCCGWRGPSDYSNLLTVPASCCGESVTTADSLKTCLRLSIQYSVGCSDSPVVNFLKGSISYTAYAMILVELILILAACCLARDLGYRLVNSN